MLHKISVFYNELHIVLRLPNAPLYSNFRINIDKSVNLEVGGYAKRKSRKSKDQS